MREAIAIIFLVSFYFNLKTVRAFLMHKVGKRDEPAEFEEGDEAETKAVWGGEFMPWFFKNRRKIKKVEEESGPRMTPGRKPEEIKPKYHPYEDTM